MRIVYFIILFTFVCNYAKNQGLTNSLNEISDMNNVLGAKNLLKNELVSGTVTGVTYTKNSDGSITCSNTATDLSYKAICEFAFKAGVKYILSGCPSGGSASTHFLQAYGNGLDKKDLGSGSTIQVSSDTTATIRIVYINGQTADETFYPMLRPASIADDTYVPYSMTNREMTPYVQAISNPNLLDNPWFTVNQRGQSSYTIVNAYSVDRWKTAIDDTNLSCTISINSDNSLTVSAPASNMWFFQNGPIIDLELLKGKTITLSVDATASDNNSGRLYSSFFANNRWDEFDATNIPAGRHITSLTFTVPSSFVYPVTSYTSFGINIYSNKSITIHSTKLEIGSVSTLHMDTAPNYQQELAKCQRYFQIIGNSGFTNNGKQVTIGMPNFTSSIWFPIYLPVPLYKTPIIEKITGTWIITQSATGNAIIENPDMSIISFNEEKDISIININVPSDNLYILNNTYKLSTRAMTNNVAQIFLSSDF